MNHLGKNKFTLDDFFYEVGVFAAFIFFSYLVVAKIHTHIMEKQEEEEEKQESS
ncbi:MAG: hypothetical protein WCL06_00125 [Bacteroidota bacterium]